MTNMFWKSGAVLASIAFYSPIGCGSPEANEKPGVQDSTNQPDSGAPMYPNPEPPPGNDAGTSGSGGGNSAADTFGAPPPPTQDYVLDAETATSKKTGLMWLRATLETSQKGGSCILRCEELTAAGRSDWRAPTMAELTGLLVDRPTCPLLDEDAFPLSLRSWYTSSDTKTGTGYDYLMLSFYSGEVKTMNEVYKDTGFPCRCVR